MLRSSIACELVGEDAVSALSEAVTADSDLDDALHAASSANFALLEQLMQHILVTRASVPLPIELTPSTPHPFAAEVQALQAHAEGGPVRLPGAPDARALHVPYGTLRLQLLVRAMLTSTDPATPFRTLAATATSS